MVLQWVNEAGPTRLPRPAWSLMSGSWTRRQPRIPNAVPAVAMAATQPWCCRDRPTAMMPPDGLPFLYPVKAQQPGAIPAAPERVRFSSPSPEPVPARSATAAAAGARLGTPLDQGVPRRAARAASGQRPGEAALVAIPGTHSERNRCVRASGAPRCSTNDGACIGHVVVYPDRRRRNTQRSRNPSANLSLGEPPPARGVS